MDRYMDSSHLQDLEDWNKMNRSVLLLVVGFLFFCSFTSGNRVHVSVNVESDNDHPHHTAKSHKSIVDSSRGQFIANHSHPEIFYRSDYEVDSAFSDSIDLLSTWTTNFKLSVEERFARFTKTFAKSQSAKQVPSRVQVFQNNVKLIDHHNSNPSRTFDLGINAFSDLSSEEVAKYKCGGKVEKPLIAYDPSPFALSAMGRASLMGSGTVNLATKSHAPKPVTHHTQAHEAEMDEAESAIDNESEAEFDSALPEYADWTSTKILGPMRDQGTCGVCWAFATTNNLEANWAKKTGMLYKLSEQQFIDCTTGVDTFGNGRTDLENTGCQGGRIPSTLAYALNHPLTYENDYPYEGRVQRCHAPSVAAPVKLVGWKYTASMNVQQMMQAVLEGPLITAIQADSYVFQNYKGGVLRDASCGQRTNHFVNIVGYGVTKVSPRFPKPLEYWIVKNSWGTSWGQNGYGYIQKGVNMCGIEEANAYPIF